MSGLLRPFSRLQTPGRQKPQGVPRIDWSHPLAQGLLFYGFDTGQGVIIDLVSGRPQNTSGTEDPTGVSAYGTGFAYNASANRYFNSDAIIRSATASGGYSCACAYIQTGTVANYTRPFGRTANNGGSPPYLNWDFEINPAGAGQNIVVADIAAPGLTTSPQWTGNANNVFTSLLLSVPLGTAIAGMLFYAQGSLAATSAAVNPGSTDVNDAICFSGVSSVGGGSFIGNVFYGAFWGRQLSADEAFWLHQDPYCFLLPAEGEMPALLGAAGNTGVGAASGIGSATAVGKSTAASVSTAAGVGVATAVGNSTTASVGAAVGIGAATAVGKSTAASVGSALGTGTATGVGATLGISTGVGFAQGIGTASAVGLSTVPTLARFILDISAHDEGQDIDFTGAEVALAIKDYDGCQKLSATIGNGLTLTSPKIIQLRVTPDQWATICPGAYRIGAVYRISGATYQIFTGQLIVQDDIATIH